MAERDYIILRNVSQMQKNRRKATVTESLKMHPFEKSWPIRKLSFNCILKDAGPYQKGRQK